MFCYFSGFYSLNWKMEFFTGVHRVRLSKLHCNFSFEMAIRLVKNGSLERNDSVTLTSIVCSMAIWHQIVDIENIIFFLSCQNWRVILRILASWISK